jgi:HEPN domain-containing protein
MTKDKVFQRAYARELAKIATGDLESAEVMAGNLAKGRKENICFAAQQSIEKLLKGILCALGKPVPMTHSIEVILDRLGSEQPPGGEGLLELTDYATIRRYEEGNEIITPEDIAVTLAAARAVLTWAVARINAILGDK